MKYAYENLSSSQFERLITLLCQDLLGISVQGFSEGPDGGRDAKFIGKANVFPSVARSWEGTTIIQAKHCNGYNRSFSEHDFFNAQANQTVIGKEIPRIQSLRKNSQLDNYMLFSNRKLSANTETDIKLYLSENCGIAEENIYLCGVEQLELYMKKYSHVPLQANLDPIDSPLIVSPDDIAEVVQGLARNKEELSRVLDAPPVPRTPYEEKNKVNNMTDSYAKELRKKYLKDTAQIKLFLASPNNLDLLKMYELAVEEFQLKIIAKRKNYQTFDEVMEYLLDLLFSRDAILRQRHHKRLTRVLLFYMYWNCDIGDTNDVAAN